MAFKLILQRVTALVAASSLLQAPFAYGDALSPQPGGPAAARAAMVAREPAISQAQEIALLRKHVKYVFVIFQENRSFDSYFGSFPGANGLFSQAPAATPGFSQPIENVDGSMAMISPFRLGPDQYAADLDDVDHAHINMAEKMDVVNGVARMDHYALDEEKKYIAPGQSLPSLMAKQYGELTMAYEDCNTIPYMWNFASRFVLFDNIFQHTIGPSTPNAIAMIAGQTGETQWVKHPDEAVGAKGLLKGQGEPVVTDDDPLWGTGNAGDNSGMPQNPHDGAKHPVIAALNQTYASLPLSMTGDNARKVTAADKDPATDLADVRQDIPALSASKAAELPWGWYEEGYDTEPNDKGVDKHDGYIGHHNGPQYFGYVANNPEMTANLHGLGDFFSDIGADRLSSTGGVYYLRGGFRNIAGLKPAFNDPAVQHNFQGDDDHPGYSDSAISEALVAREVNAIARSKYWAQSAIIITYDESEGDYDHVPPTFVEYDPQGLPLSRGPRIPLIVISPYARAHVVSHESGDHASVIKFIDLLYNLPPLADLPDEAQARVAGLKMFKQAYLGPADDNTPGVGNLLSAFDPARLEGKTSPLPAAYAMTPDISAIPPDNNQGCKVIGIVPVDIAQGIVNHIPADFNPRPKTDPTAAQ
ncbi:acid phosphatase [Acidocella aquatica]|uniref:Acid phosphatase n=1 Tax=Acidocella aquatica TaxID=1922313 RepID=A0ABQ6A8D7_9PROT|nr:alkaline phosphatase family protein [Acidocella aquatica]GLR67997.1 acid phosphatase [Acidocella aquatica]